MTHPLSRSASSAPPRTVREAADRLGAGIGLDVRDAAALASLLEEQFQGALHHDASALASLAPRIEALVEGMERRRAERVALAETLIGRGARMAALIARLPAPRRPALDAGWRALEQLVTRCKTLNQRNCHLMTDQHTILQRVLHGETETYAPA